MAGEQWLILLPEKWNRHVQYARIVVGQKDGKRLQVDLAADDNIVYELRKVLGEVGELSGRDPKEWRALHSIPGCREQRLHRDYNPDKVEGAPLKAASVIAALQDGTRLIVGEKKQCVQLFAGDVLVFDGDVLHAGAPYADANTRVHVYLDVPGQERERDYTWDVRKPQ